MSNEILTSFFFALFRIVLLQHSFIFNLNGENQMGMSQSREMENFNLVHACNRPLESLKPKNSDNNPGFETGYWRKTL
jgi:hypothetical protein